MSLDKRILFMDAEEMMRKVAGRLFPALGYQIEIVSEGSEAVEKYRAAAENGGKFNAVILDYAVDRGMNGAETAKKILEYDPDAKLILSSGGAEIDFAKYGFKASLPKPYTMDMIKKAIDPALR
jgi:CheY-like chemotaxis protein